MPSGPRSTACAKCKARRTKCDQLWPTCTQCRRKRTECPGPSSLIKFVPPSTKASPATGAQKKVDVVNKPEASAAKSVEIVTLTRMKPYAGGLGGAQSGIFRLKVPQPQLTTPADRVSAQLVSLLQSNLQAAFGVLGDLPGLPQRLSHSSALLDCATLYCHTWQQCPDPHKPLDSVVQASLYGKAIKGLQRSVISTKLYTLETLTAMVMMEFLIARCSKASAQELRPHRQAIRHVVKTLGMPDPKDSSAPFHTALIRITGYMMRNLAYSENLKPDAYFESPWKETFFSRDSSWVGSSKDDERDGLGSVEETEEERNDMIEFEATFELGFDILTASTSHARQKLLEVRANPEETKTERVLLIQQISKAARYLGVLSRRRWSELKTAGVVTEHPDPDSFVGRRYEFPFRKDTRVAITLFALRAIVLRTIYDLYTMDEIFDSSIYEAYRDLCFHVWACLPQLSKEPPLSVRDTLMLVVPLFQAADDDELRYLHTIKFDWTVLGAPKTMDVKEFWTWIVAYSKDWN